MATDCLLVTSSLGGKFSGDIARLYIVSAPTMPTRIQGLVPATGVARGDARHIKPNNVPQTRRRISRSTELSADPTPSMQPIVYRRARRGAHVNKSYAWARTPDPKRSISKFQKPAYSKLDAPDIDIERLVVYADPEMAHCRLLL